MNLIENFLKMELEQDKDYLDGCVWKCGAGNSNSKKDQHQTVRVQILVGLKNPLLRANQIVLLGLFKLFFVGATIRACYSVNN